MKKLFILLLNLTIILPLFSATHHHSDENEVRYVSVNMEIDPQYQQLLREGNLWNNFRNNNPNWFVIFNERNQMPHRAFGQPIPVNNLRTFLSLAY